MCFLRYVKNVPDKTLAPVVTLIIRDAHEPRVSAVNNTSSPSIRLRNDALATRRELFHLPMFPPSGESERLRMQKPTVINKVKNAARHPKICPCRQCGVLADKFDNNYFAVEAATKKALFDLGITQADAKDITYPLIRRFLLGRYDWLPA